MADFNSSLPVRTQNNGDVVVNIADGTTETQKLAVDSSGRITTKIDDGNGNAITSQANGAQRALDVGIDVAGVQIDPRQIRALTSSDVVTAQQGTSPFITSDLADGAVSGGTAGTKSLLAGGIYNSTALTLTTGQQASLQLNASGALLVSTSSASSSTTVIQGTTPWVDNITQIGGSAIALGQTTMSASLPVVIASNQSAINVLNTADGSLSGGTAGTQSLAAGAIYNSTALTLTNGQQAALQSDSSGNLKVNLQTSIPAGTNLIGGTNVYVGGSIASTTNPVPVSLSTIQAGTPVQFYGTAASVAPGSSATITYTVAASHTFTLEQVYASASGKIKVVVQNGSNTIFVGFNSTANPNVNFVLSVPPVIAAAGTVNVIITNDDLSAFDVYATIEGNQN